MSLGPLEFLRTQPQFQQLRQVVQRNPALLQPLLQQIGQNNPNLLAVCWRRGSPSCVGHALTACAWPRQMINQNQQEFLRLLEEDAGDAPPAGNVIQVTAEERDAIQRLEALGFSRARVLEAFLACDRNEELAANYLFEHGNEED